MVTRKKTCGWNLLLRLHILNTVYTAEGGADCEVSWQSRVVDLPFFSNQERKVLDQVVVLHGGLSAQTCVNCSQGIVAGEEQDEKKKFESSHFVHCIDANTRWNGVHYTYLPTLLQLFIFPIVWNCLFKKKLNFLEKASHNFLEKAVFFLNSSFVGR